ncbi:MULTISPECIES: hypothetical protein [unclassified Streptomyces]|uniref:hypothetical protein n=1 Tax=unclassified Streptomyces TaxID=2593676 RepID=UPI000AC894FE|nr:MULTISPECIES: hypothetical protein [unclassified Streptomyces]
MDQGIAGLAGAVAGGLIGIVGTLGAARLTGRDQSRSQREQWHRQIRRETYSQYIVKYTTAVKAGNAAHEAVFKERTDAEALLRGFEAAVHEVEVARTLVALEGPEEVADAAVDALTELSPWVWGLSVVWKGEDTRSLAMARQKAIDATHLAQDQIDEVTHIFAASLGGGRVVTRG